MTDSIKFDRRPYTVSYIDSEGQQQKIRRVPPPKLHEALPTDKVELTRRHSDDFPLDDEVTVKSISPRQPNTLKVENAEGQTTFVSYSDMKLKEKLTAQDGIPLERLPERNKYLLWP
jgi:hypothetical protein